MPRNTLKRKSVHRLKTADIGTLKKLRALTQRLECKSLFESQNAAGLKSRLARMSAEVSEIARKELRPFCNCQQSTFVDSWETEDFAAEMEIPCPIHGPCRLGILVIICGYPSDGDPRDQRLYELVREYDRRCLARNDRRKRDESQKAL